MSTPTVAPPRQRAFRHEALLYEGEPEFLDVATAFIRDALAADEPTLVVVSADKIAKLQSSVGDNDLVCFADMSVVGSNPARIIPAWRQFAAEHSGRRLRGIGEPIWAGRSDAELVECQRHESLLNVAFAEAAEFWLLCPYDTTALHPEVIDEALRSHPFVLAASTSADSRDYRGVDAAAAPFEDPLPEPPGRPAEFAFGPGMLTDLRAFVAHHAAGAGLDAERISDLVFATNELATNSLLYGGGHGSVRIWHQDGVICEIGDAGNISDPLIGRHSPGSDDDGGRGVWIANQLCDLLQLRSSPAGSIARLHVRAS